MKTCPHCKQPLWGWREYESIYTDYEVDANEEAMVVDSGSRGDDAGTYTLFCKECGKELPYSKVSDLIKDIKKNHEES